MAEVKLGQLVHAVAVQPAFEDVGDQHGIVDGRDVDAVAGEDGHVVFGVLADLQDGGVFEQDLEFGEGLAAIELFPVLAAVFVLGRTAKIKADIGLRFRLAVAHRDVGRFAGADGDGDAAELRIV